MQKAKKHEPFTAEKLKTFKGLEGLSDNEAEKACDELRSLARILFKMYQQKTKR